MVSYVTLLGAIAPVFLVMGAGFALRKARVFTEEADASVMRMIIYVLYPALILRFILGNERLMDSTELVAPPLVGLGTICLGYLAAYLAAPLLGIRNAVARRTFAFTVGIYNYGYIPIPIIDALFGSEAMTGLLLVHNLGVEVAFWTVGILILNGSFDRSALRRIANPAVIAMALALALNFTGAASTIPAFVYRTIEITAACAIPVGLFLSGATIANLVTRVTLPGNGAKTALGAVLLRLALIPVCFLLIARFMPGLSDELRAIIVIQSAMPSGLFPIVVTRHYNGDTATATRVILTTTLVSLITIPFWIAMGLRFAGL